MNNPFKRRKRDACKFIVLHFPDAERAARFVNEYWHEIPSREMRMMDGGERLGIKGECYGK